MREKRREEKRREEKRREEKRREEKRREEKRREKKRKERNFNLNFFFFLFSRSHNGTSQVTFHTHAVSLTSKSSLFPLPFIHQFLKKKIGRSNWILP